MPSSLQERGTSTSHELATSTHQVGAISSEIPHRRCAGPKLRCLPAGLRLRAFPRLVFWSWREAPLRAGRQDLLGRPPNALAAQRTRLLLADRRLGGHAKSGGSHPGSNEPCNDATVRNGCCRRRGRWPQIGVPVRPIPAGRRGASRSLLTLSRDSRTPRTRVCLIENLKENRTGHAHRQIF
jgi:hypothetical protein